VSVGLQSRAAGCRGCGSSAPGYRGRGCSLLRSRVSGAGLQSPPLPVSGAGLQSPPLPVSGAGLQSPPLPGIGGGAAVSSAPGYRGRGCSLGCSLSIGEPGASRPWLRLRLQASGPRAWLQKRKKKTEEQLTRITQPERNTLTVLIQNSTIPFQ
jgi:hypothetical protein